MTQDATPALIVPAEMLIEEGPTSDTEAAQPAPDTVAVAPAVSRRPAGSVSTKAIPDCAGLPAALVSRKRSAVLPPDAIDGAAKLLVSVASGVAGPTVV